MISIRDSDREMHEEGVERALAIMEQATTLIERLVGKQPAHSSIREES